MMNIDSIELTPYDGPLKKEKDFDPELMEVSRQFEAVFMSHMLRDGFKAAENFKSEDDQDAGSKSYKEMAHSQLANYVGAHSNSGLAEAIYRSLKR